MPMQFTHVRSLAFRFRRFASVGLRLLRRFRVATAPPQEVMWGFDPPGRKVLGCFLPWIACDWQDRAFPYLATLPKKGSKKRLPKPLAAQNVADRPESLRKSSFREPLHGFSRAKMLC